MVWFMEITRHEAWLVLLDRRRQALDRYERPESSAIRAEQALELRRALQHLSWREREILKSRFGIGCEAKTIEAVARDFGITRERVLQIQQKGLSRLRCISVLRHL